jgi:hypothetical protein
MDSYSAILFHSPNYAIWTAKVLKKNSIGGKMIPIPRNLSSDCGYCVRIFSTDVERAVEVINSNSIEFDRIEDL